VPPVVIDLCQHFDHIFGILAGPDTTDPRSDFHPKVFNMSWELTRRRWLRTLNSRFIYGRIPLLHAIIFFIEMALFARLTSRFNSYYDERPRTYPTPNTADRPNAEFENSTTY